MGDDPVADDRRRSGEEFLRGKTVTSYDLAGAGMLRLKSLKVGRGRSPAASGRFIDRTPGGVTSVMSHDHSGATNALPASRSRTGHRHDHGHGQTHSLSSKAIQGYFGALEPLTVLWRRRNIVGAKTLIRVSRVVGGPPHGEACGPRS